MSRKHFSQALYEQTSPPFASLSVTLTMHVLSSVRSV